MPVPGWDRLISLESPFNTFMGILGDICIDFDPPLGAFVWWSGQV